MNDLFRFVGDQDGGLGYRYGKIYMLELAGRGATRVGVTIESPIRCPYKDWNAFFGNWERV